MLSTFTQRRFCVHGHEDPDTQWLRVCSPSPQTGTLMVALHSAANSTLQLPTAKRRFARAHLLKEREQLLVTFDTVWVAVWELDDAPAEFRATLTAHFYSNGIATSLLDPCLWWQGGASGKLGVFHVVGCGEHPQGCQWTA